MCFLLPLASLAQRQCVTFLCVLCLWLHRFFIGGICHSELVGIQVLSLLRLLGVAVLGVRLHTPFGEYGCEIGVRNEKLASGFAQIQLL